MDHSDVGKVKEDTNGQNHNCTVRTVDGQGVVDDAAAAVELGIVRLVVVEWDSNMLMEVAASYC